MAAGAGSSGDSSAREPLRFAVGVDGSDLSGRAFDACMSLMHPGDYVTLVHIGDREKEGLPYRDKPESIVDKFTSKLVPLVRKGLYEVRVRYKHVGEETKDALCRYLNDDANHFDIVVLGVIGRKGPKDDPTILGSTADYSMRAAHMTAVLVRNREVDRPATFFVGTDGSKTAHESVRLTLRVAQDDDVIIVSHAEDPIEERRVDKEFTSAGIRKAFDAEFAKDPRCSLDIFVKKPDLTVSESIVQRARDKDATFIVIGADGVGAYASGKSVWGSVSDKVVKNAKCSVIVTQKKGKVYLPRKEGDTLTDE